MRVVHAVSEQHHRADPPAARSFVRVAQICLLSTGLIALLSLFQAILDYAANEAFGRIPISASNALAILGASAGLALSFLRQSPVKRILSILFGMATAISGLDGLIGRWWSSRAIASGEAELTSFVPPLAFVLLGLSIILLRSRTPAAGRVANAVLLGTVWIALILVFGAVFDAVHLFGTARLPVIHWPALAAFVLLTLVALGLRAQSAISSTFLGHGAGPRMARRLLPVVLLLPILAEFGRACLVRLNLIGAPDAAALLAAVTTLLSLAAIIVISRRFKRFEAEIRDLTLYDELTGLYNLRGFQLMADYVLRLSARSGMPFSILYVSVDNFSRVNQIHGHRVASRLLAETAELLRSQFRETDVVARIGEDEFVVAGSFSVAVIERAEQRILAEPPPGDEPEIRKPRLKLNTGYASINPQRPESLQDLLQRADAAMYQRKRHRKLQVV